MPQLLKEKSIYKSLMECILTFYTGRVPNTPLEAKAKSWAISQLRSTTNVSSGGRDGTPLALMGGDQEHLYHCYLLKMSRDLSTCLRTETQRLCRGSDRHHSTITCLPEYVLKNTDFFMYLLHYPEMTELAEALLERIALHPGSDNAISLFVSLTEHQKKSRESTRPVLSYRFLTLLWLHYFPSLEDEVLFTVRSVLLQDYWTPDVKKRLKSWHLPRACAEHASLYQAVGHMLGELLLHTNGDWRVVEFIGSFHTVVREAEAMCHTQLSRPLTSLRGCYSPDLQHLVTLLQVSPSDLTQAGIFTQIQSIGRCVSTVSHKQYSEQNCELWQCLVQFPAWYQACLHHCLAASSQQLDSCVTLILWYKLPLRVNRCPDIKTNLMETIFMLQGLMSKSSLKVQDMEYAVSTYQNSHGCHVISPLIGQILMVFLVLSKSGMSIGQFILNKASLTDDVKVQLQFILHTIDILGGATALGQLIPPDRGRELHTLIASLTSQAGFPQVKLDAHPNAGQDLSASADIGPGYSLTEKIADVLNSLSTT
ncbi:uncharacterized protein LOC135471131 isoform X2 [Liolophura sinensis]